MARQTAIQKRINRMAGFRGSPSGDGNTPVVSRKNARYNNSTSGLPAKPRSSGLDGRRDITGTRSSFGNRADKYRDIRASFGLSTG